MCFCQVFFKIREMKSEIRLGLQFFLVKVKHFDIFHAHSHFVDRFPPTSKVSLNKEASWQTAKALFCRTYGGASKPPNIGNQVPHPNGTLPPCHVMLLIVSSHPLAFVGVGGGRVFTKL